MACASTTKTFTEQRRWGRRGPILAAHVQCGDNRLREWDFGEHERDRRGAGARMTPVARAVGRYEILEEIGRGGMARVYLARQTDLDRLVALKELSTFHATDPNFARRFLRESRLAGSLSHPNIVTVHEYFEYEG